MWLHNIISDSKTSQYTYERKESADYLVVHSNVAVWKHRICILHFILWFEFTIAINSITNAALINSRISHYANDCKVTNIAYSDKTYR